MILSEERSSAGAELVFTEGPTGNTAEDKLVRYILGYVGQKERTQTAERTMGGKISVAESGRMPNGTGAGLFGYDYDPGAKVRTINAKEAATALRVFRWAAEGLSLFKTATRLNKEGIPTKSGKMWHGSKTKMMRVAMFGVGGVGGASNSV